MKVNLKKYKMGYGPMSMEIIDLLSKYSHHYPLMVVASLNQVDTFNGYVCNQKTLRDRVSQSVLLCRDHCGPYFKYSDRNLLLSKAIEECKKSIEQDIANGFDLIHIDVSRVNETPFKVAETLIDHAIRLKSDILLEFGSEENTGYNLNASLDDQLKFCLNYKDNIKFIVTQTGSLVKDKQIGNFDVYRNKKLSNKIHELGFLFKEHNGDYLDAEGLRKRQLAGIDAINVAPQLGVLQTQILYKLSNGTEAWRNFAETVYRGRRFEQWLSTNDSRLTAVIVSGHYFYNTVEYKKLKDSIDLDQFEIELKNNLYEVLDFYENRS
jgi:hypothetical protein